MQEICSNKIHEYVDCILFMLDIFSMNWSQYQLISIIDWVVLGPNAAIYLSSIQIWTIMSAQKLSQIDKFWTP